MQVNLNNRHLTGPRIRAQDTPVLCSSFEYNQYYSSGRCHIVLCTKLLNSPRHDIFRLRLQGVLTGKRRGFGPHLLSLGLEFLSIDIISLPSTTTTNMSNSQDAFELRQKYKHFRVLVIGRANAGKTTLLKRVCNTTEEPCIYDEHNNDLVSFVLICCIIPVLIVPL